MDASRYKDYMLGLMFYKFLSDKTLDEFRATSGLGKVTEAELVTQYAQAYEEYGDQLQQMFQSTLGYYVAPEYLYQTWLRAINSGTFEVQKVTDSLNNFERTIAVSDKDKNKFQGLFSSSALDLTDTALGGDLNARSKNIKALILLFADLNMVALQKGDVLGDAYEYLIGQFAMESGKKAGEFYTPRQVSEVMAQIVAKTPGIKSIYDPTVGSGSLLLTVKKHLHVEAQKNLSYYGQEKNTATYNLTRMNLLLHGVRPEKMEINNGDTLDQDWPEDPSRPGEGVQFEAVVMNPPYSAKNWNRAGLKVSDPRFEIAGTLPPDSKGDMAFLLHGLFHLGQEGTMAIVLPHGVLFRGGAEGEIRKKLIDKNQIDTIIGLPSQLFTNTGIPVTILILKKNRSLGEPVLIIDASRHHIKVGKQNVLQEKDIAKIVDTYVHRTEEKGYSRRVSRETIVENQYNLNIPRYIEAIDEEIAHDVDAHLLGGIPQANIDELQTLQDAVPHLLANALHEVRPGYVELVKSVEDLALEISQDDRIMQQSQEIEDKAQGYIQRYFDILRAVDRNTDLTQLMNDMLEEIKKLLAEYPHLDQYRGYQIVAEIWKQALTHDTELIVQSDFYTVGRTREPNMVTKGSGEKKREEQDGWVGSMVPNELIAKHLYRQELEAIESKNSRIQEIDSELSDLAEAAKVEESDEANALAESLNEAGEALESKLVKAELKKAAKGSQEHKLLSQVEDLFTEKATLAKSVKAEEKVLKEAVYKRILTLTNEEIDRLVYAKWFGGTQEAIVALVEQPLRAELRTLQMLHERYQDTLAVLDEESRALEAEFEALMSELVVGE